ncbi:MAG: hypothetical protein GX193_04235, partial [Clostridiales bacterium]|nr:hypothetical protein [Clostridiales bacterium]
IITDGEENSSREYSYARVKSLVERQKAEYGWEFIFLGANMDAIRAASRFGIGADRAVDYISDSEGTRLNFKVMSTTVARFRESGIVEDSCFEEIRDYVKRRRKNKP